MSVEIILVQKVKPVFPSPLMIAPREVLVYIKGQIKLRDMINVPAKLLWNKNAPKNFPKVKNPIKQTEKKLKDNPIDFGFG